MVLTMSVSLRFKANRSFQGQEKRKRQPQTVLTGWLVEILPIVGSWVSPLNQVG
jgi:hypothetical protein